MVEFGLGLGDSWFAANVRSVNLRYTLVSDLSPLADLKNLQRLVLYDTPVSDLSPLAELKNLRYLDLSSTQVSDLSPLAELKSLEQLHLNNTPVSDEQVQKLRQALPNCVIYYPFSAYSIRVEN